jgi:hypothetical protein
VLILKVVKVLCFDTLLQVLILNGVTGGILMHFLQVLILNNLAEKRLGRRENEDDNYRRALRRITRGLVYYNDKKSQGEFG